MIIPIPRLCLYRTKELTLGAIFFVLAMSLTACGVTPRFDANAYANKALKVGDSHVRRTGFPICAQARPDPDGDGLCDRRLFVGVAISGGGSRAANFGLGALLQLQELGLLDETTAISSVSGGSLAASYVALFGIDSDAAFDSAARALRQDFLSGWVWRSLSPQRILQVNFSHSTATRTLADTFDELLFHGRTFSDLGDFAPANPYLYLNAALQNPVSARSRLATRGENTPSTDLQGFTFSTAAFDELGSNLGSYRIADAVAASGAYPGLFEPMVLKNFQDIQLPGDPPSEYLHLSDGGAADNLGVDALIRALQEFEADGLDLHNQKKACLLIIVDAAAHDPAQRPGSLPDLRDGPMNSVVSSSIYRAFDLLLDRRREDELAALGIDQASDNPVRFRSAVNIALGNYSYLDNGSSKVRSRSPIYTLAPPNDSPNYHTSVSCAVWHVSFDHMTEVATGRSKFQQENFGPWPWIHEKPMPTRGREIEKLEYLVNSVATNYRLELSGRSRCSTTTIQNSLFDASRVLMRDDVRTLLELSEWLRSKDREDLAKSVLDSELFEVPVATAPFYTTHRPGPHSDANAWIECD